MRLIPIPHNGADLFGIDSSIVQAHMFWPEDAVKRQQLIDGEHREIAAHMLRENVDPTTRLSGASLREKRARLADLLQVESLNNSCAAFDGTHGWRDGGIVAWMMIYLAGSHAVDPKLATINQAIRVGMKTSDFGRQTVRNAWQRFRSVAHLWAAENILFSEDYDWLEAPAHEGVPALLSVAEAFRRFGVGHGYAAEDGAAILPQNCWAAPDGYFSHIELTGLQLQEWTIEAARDKSILTR